MGGYSMRKYRTIKNKTYNNVMYIAKLIEKIKGYPEKEAIEIALKQFDAGIFNYWSVETLLNNLVDCEQYKTNVYMHNFNMQGIY